MDKKNYAIIMAGGIGSRFWPLSRKILPKQFLDILGIGETLIQQTFRRLSLLCPKENIYIVTNKDYFDLCKEQIEEIKVSQILCEPVMRNTAPCIAYAAFKIHAKDPDAKLIVAPSDHLITNEVEYVNIVNRVFKIISLQDIIVTLGIQPNRPDTGYGYIQYDESHNLLKDNKLKKVKTFTEKPDLELALQFLDSGDFLWNAGIFIFSSKVIVASYRKHLRDIYDIFDSGNQFYNTNKEHDFIEHAFPSCKNISIDYGILEKSDIVYVYPSDFGWSDLGTWGSIDNHLIKDDSNNSARGNDVNLYNSQNNIVFTNTIRECVINGLDGYIVVENEGSLLICKKEDEQQIKTFVSDLKNKS
ncbi:MAG: mannose-1-phosphate guanylyltransferase [Flavobacteriales bacterium]|nr:mannose-1-phosphate guanylyltransferase [Flavobacteriales bacterium]